MKIKVNQENCIGCGACEAISPDLFEVSDVCNIKESNIPKDKEQEAKEAIESCPTSAISEE